MTVVRFSIEGTGSPLFACTRLDYTPTINSFVEFDGDTYKVESVTLKMFQTTATSGMKGLPEPGTALPELLVTVSLVP